MVRGFFQCFDFYPRPPRGGRLIHTVESCFYIGFLSTSSARRTTTEQTGHNKGDRNFYPRPPRGGRPGLECSPVYARPISIHVLREEDDKA